LTRYVQFLIHKYVPILKKSLKKLFNVKFKKHSTINERMNITYLNDLTYIGRSVFASKLCKLASSCNYLTAKPIPSIDGI
jgi:hypothetical protein